METDCRSGARPRETPPIGRDAKKAKKSTELSPSPGCFFGARGDSLSAKDDRAQRRFLFLRRRFELPVSDELAKAVGDEPLVSENGELQFIFPQLVRHRPHEFGHVGDVIAIQQGAEHLQYDILRQILRVVEIPAPFQREAVDGL